VGELILTRNVGITLTDLAYQVWQGIPHGLRSKVISGFLTENAKELTSLESPYENFHKRLILNKNKAEDDIQEMLYKIYDENE
jgi:hypothetical protein